MAATMKRMGTMEARLDAQLTCTNNEVRGLRDRVALGEATLDGKIDAAVSKAVDTAVISDLEGK